MSRRPLPNDPRQFPSSTVLHQYNSLQILVRRAPLDGYFRLSLCYNLDRWNGESLIMSKLTTKARQLAEEQLDLLLQEHCDEVAHEPTPARLIKLASRLQTLVNAREIAEPLRASIRLNQQSWQDYDLSGWNAPVYHS